MSAAAVPVTPAPSPSPSTDEIAQKLLAILRSEEFQPGVSDALRRWIERAWRGLRFWAESLSFVQSIVVAAACLAALVLIGYLIWRSAKARIRIDEALPLASPAARGTALPTPWERIEETRRLIGQGRLREAAATLQHALLLTLCAENKVAWRPNTTDWEWIALLRPSAWAVEMTRRTERLAYGPGVMVSRGELDACVAEVAERIESSGAISMATPRSKSLSTTNTPGERA